MANRSLAYLTSFRMSSSSATTLDFTVSTEISDKLNYVDGLRVKPSKSKEKFKLIAPYNGHQVVECFSTSTDDVNAAVQSAKAALPTWSRMTGLERGTILHRAAELIKSNVESIARLETLHNGKPIYESRVDVFYTAEAVNYYGSLAASVTGDHIPASNGNFIYTRKEPLGICGGIGAWNYPFQTCAWKCAPALAAGNAFVYKPSPWAPLSPVVMAEVLTAAGLPAGVFNVVQGERETGEALVSHSDIAKISFTGSVPTGQRIMELCARRGLKRVTLELGGKSPLLIFDDAPMENALKGAMNANYFTQGEVCSNAARVYVQQSVYDRFVERLVDRVKRVKIGNPFEENTLVGAVITKTHMEKIDQYVQSARQQGAIIAYGGERWKPDNTKIKDGNYYLPTVIVNATDEMTVVKEEIFGPVMCVLPFETEEEVVTRANNTPYGLSAGVFTNNLQRAHRIAAKLEAGFVWINNYNVQPVEAPFGGYKLSGFGREMGKEGLEAYLQTKSIYVELGDVDSKF